MEQKSIGANSLKKAFDAVVALFREDIEIDPMEATEGLGRALQLAALSPESREVCGSSRRAWKSTTLSMPSCGTTVWRRIMKDGTFPPVSFLGTIGMLLPRIEADATKLMSISNVTEVGDRRLNSTVHLPTYNKLISEEALALQACLEPGPVCPGPAKRGVEA